MFYELAVWVALDRFFPMWIRERAVKYIARKDFERKSFSVRLRERYPVARKVPRGGKPQLVRKNGKSVR